MGQSYATLDDRRRYGINMDAYASLNDAQMTASNVAASRYADAALASAYKLPLVQWTEDLTANVCYLADELDQEHVGFNPEGDGGGSIGRRADRARKYFTDIANDRLHPPGFVDSSAPETISAEAPDLSTSPERGVAPRRWA